jgi:hypothetical protein
MCQLFFTYIFIDIYSEHSKVFCTGKERALTFGVDKGKTQGCVGSDEGPFQTPTAPKNFKTTP